MGFTAARRKYYDAAHFAGVKRGETFSVDSGLGGSFIVEYRGRDSAGRYIFHRHASYHDGFPAQTYRFTADEVGSEIFIWVNAG